MYSYKKIIPRITSEGGTRVRDLTMQDHLTSVIHKECHKASLTSNNFVSRIVTGHIAENYDFNTNDTSEIDKNFNFQYATPAGLREFLEFIVQSHIPTFQNQFASALAVSLRCDGSIDRTQVDKIYTTAKVVAKADEDLIYFMGLAEPAGRGAVELLDAVLQGCQNTLGSQSAEVLRTSSSIVTDGAKVNTGEQNGLWTLLENEIKKLSDEEKAAGIILPPLLKIWYAVHWWSKTCLLLTLYFQHKFDEFKTRLKNV